MDVEDDPHVGLLMLDYLKYCYDKKYCKIYNGNESTTVASLNLVNKRKNLEKKGEKIFKRIKNKELNGIEVLSQEYWESLGINPFKYFP